MKQNEIPDEIRLFYISDGWKIETIENEYGLLLEVTASREKQIRNDYWKWNGYLFILDNVGKIEWI